MAIALLLQVTQDILALDERLALSKKSLALFFALRIFRKETYGVAVSCPNCQ
jgi:hypothetical protein